MTLSMTPAFTTVATVAAAAPLASVSAAAHDCEWWREEAARAGTDRSGLVAAALEMMVAAGIVERPQPETITPWDVPGWREAALEYHKDRGDRVSIVPYAPENLAQLRRLMAESVSIDRAWQELNDVRNRPTPKATIDAVWWAICEHGMRAFAEPLIADRIANFDEAARSELDRRIAGMGVEK